MRPATAWARPGVMLEQRRELLADGAARRPMMFWMRLLIWNTLASRWDVKKADLPLQTNGSSTQAERRRWSALSYRRR